MSQLKQSVSSFLIESLYDYGLRHTFGVPGDFVLGFNGLGAVCVTYCVGGRPQSLGNYIREITWGIDPETR